MKKVVKLILIFLGSILGATMLMIIITTAGFLFDHFFYNASVSKEEKEVDKTSSCSDCECEECEESEESQEDSMESDEQEDEDSIEYKTEFDFNINANGELIISEIMEGESLELGRHYLSFDKNPGLIVGNGLFINDRYISFQFFDGTTGCMDPIDPNDPDYLQCLEDDKSKKQELQRLGGIWLYNIQEDIFDHIVEIPVTESISDFEIIDVEWIKGTSYLYYLAEYTDSENGNCEQDFLMNIEDGRSFSISLNCFASDSGESV